MVLLPRAVLFLSLLLGASTVTSAQCVDTQPLQALFAGNPISDEFGTQVSVVGDWLAVGAPDQNTFGVVSMYHFERDQWVLKQQLTHQINPAFNYGRCVALSRDVLAVGQSSSPGGVFVYRRSGQVWSLEQWLQPSDGLVPMAGKAFGSAVDIEGDLLVVGDEGNDVLVGNGGAAYVFRFDGSHWVEEQKLFPNPSVGGDFVGESVAIDAGTIAVSGEMHGEPDEGAVFLYQHDGAQWQQVDYVTNEAGPAGDGFASSMDVRGDLLAVGAPFPTFGFPPITTGIVHLFREGPTGWEFERMLVPVGQQAPDRAFGISVAFHGNALLVGSAGDFLAAPGSEPGAVFVFRETLTGGWVQQTRLTPTPIPGDMVFNDVAMSGRHLIVGAPRDSTLSLAAGAVYPFEVSPLSLVVDVQSAAPGDPLQFQACGGAPGAQAGLLITELDGEPVSIAVVQGSCNSIGRFNAMTQLPLLAGQTTVFQCVGGLPSGEAGLSNDIDIALDD
jgi:hypothetical protein